ncbi:MAG: response regulator [Gammaproteobacteria bacterium]|nr:response regulator [Gammaproteobacteria bacterium]
MSNPSIVADKGPDSVPTIVIVDDEALIRETLRDYLQLHDFRVLEAAGGKALRDLVEAGEAMDLVVLDIRMPGEDGLSLARFLRESTDVAIVMATAAGEVVDRVVGLEMGADDYVAKPVDLRELLARIRAVLRRGTRVRNDATPVPQASVSLRFGPYSIDADARKLFDPHGAEVTLTAMEFDLVRAFAEHPGRVLTRDQLLDLAHHRRWDPFDRSIDIRVGRIRRKLEREPQRPTLIKTVHGIGYVYSGDAG